MPVPGQGMGSSASQHPREAPYSLMGHDGSQKLSLLVGGVQCGPDRGIWYYRDAARRGCRCFVGTRLRFTAATQACWLPWIRVCFPVAPHSQGVFPPGTFANLGLPSHWYGCLEWQYPPHQRQGSWAEEGRSVNHLKVCISGHRGAG